MYSILGGRGHLLVAVWTLVDLAVFIVRHRPVQHVCLHVDLVSLAVFERPVRTNGADERLGRAMD